MLLAVRASSRKRLRKSRSLLPASVRILSATVRPNSVSVARYTCAIPPPKYSRSSYFPIRAGRRMGGFRGMPASFGNSGYATQLRPEILAEHGGRSVGIDQDLVFENDLARLTLARLHDEDGGSAGRDVVVCMGEEM